MIAITAPPSKSLSHRMLIAAALARGESVLHHVLDSDDITRTRRILCAAGARMEDLPDGGLRVRGVAGVLQGAALDSMEQCNFENVTLLRKDLPANPCREIGVGGLCPPLSDNLKRKPLTDALSCDVHESGTSCRLLTAILAAGQGRFRIHGAGRMHERPIGTLTSALETLGTSVRFEGQAGCPPFVLEARGLRGGTITMSLDESSQYLSGLLLAAPLCREPLTITLGGTKTLSWPYVGLTLQILEDFGVPFEVWEKAGSWRETDWRSLREARPDRLRFHMRPAAYLAGDFWVEGDWSGASYFLAAGALGKYPVRVQGLRKDSLQGDRALLDILRRMGAAIEEGEAGVTVHPSPLCAIDVDMGHCPDLAPTVAVLAAFAQGASTIRNVAHLRIKESDRIAAPAANLRAAGIAVQEREDGLVIEGGIPRPAPLFRAFGDHRIAMSAAVLGLRHGPVRLDDPTVIAKSFPDFWELWEKILVRT